MIVVSSNSDGSSGSSASHVRACVHVVQGQQDLCVERGGAHETFVVVDASMSKCLLFAGPPSIGIMCRCYPFVRTGYFYQQNACVQAE